MRRIIQRFIDFASIATFFVVIMLFCEIVKADNIDFFEHVFSHSEPLCEDGTFINGRVQESGSGSGLANVPVLLIPTNSQEDAILGLTDSLGEFVFKGLSEQDYFIQVMDANLHAVRGYKRSNSNLLQLKPQNCSDNPLIFEYEDIDTNVIGGLLWYDLNGNGIQDEWYDSNDDGLVTLNKTDTLGYIRFEEYEWIDLNGDGNFAGPENIGELNNAGLSNLISGNVIIAQDEFEIARENIGATGYYFHYQDDSGSYRALVEIDVFLYEDIRKVANSGLVKIIPNFGARTSPYIDEEDGLECGPTQVEYYDYTIIEGSPLRLDLPFGIRCQEWTERKIIVANDDNFGAIAFDFDGVIGNILSNDLINNREIADDEIDFVFEELDGIVGLLINPNGELSLVPGLNEPREYRLRYVLSEDGNPDNKDDAFVTFQILESIIDLSISKTSNNVEIYEGDSFDYIIELSNLGNAPASEVIIVDELPLGISYQHSHFEFEGDVNVETEVEGGIISYSIPELARGAVLKIILNVKADKLTSTNPMTITNTVALRWGNQEDIKNNTASDTNVINPFFIPNVITPNGDGKNDTFEIRGIARFDSTKLVIFNRYGDHVFESNNYQNDWDASGLPSGTYYYVLETKDVEGRSNEYKNWIQVIK